MADSFYQTLGVSQNASQDDLKNAFRQKAKTLHPDRNPNDPNAEARFKSLNEAYDVLKDPQKRDAYDRFGHDAFINNLRSAGNNHEAHAGFSDAFSDLFESVFGARSRRRRTRGDDLAQETFLSLEDVANGVTVQVQTPSRAPCNPCNSTGDADKKPPQTCPSCNGEGVLLSKRGFMTMQRTCPSCRGAGASINNPCPSCRGAGFLEKHETHDVHIPPGVADGQQLRLKAKGAPSPDKGPNGDFFIVVRVKPHKIFSRQGHNLYADVHVPFSLVSLGGHVNAPSLLNGPLRVHIPPGNDPMKQLRLRGQGLPVPGNPVRRGDVILRVIPEIPASLSKKQQDLLLAFHRSLANKNIPKSAHAHPVVAHDEPKKSSSKKSPSKKDSKDSKKSARS